MKNQNILRIANKTKNTIISRNARVADTFLPRLIGLLTRESLLLDEALLITRCQSIHMFFMRFAIDAIFVDYNDRVVGLVENIKPFQLSPIFFKASYVIEAATGTIAKTKTSVGDEVELKEPSGHGCHL